MPSARRKPRDPEVRPRIGGRVNRYARLKVSYSWMQIEGSSSSKSNVFGFQLVTSFRPVQWAWR